jgi:hypothetical protein
MKRPEEKYLVDTQALTQNTLTALPLGVVPAQSIPQLAVLYDRFANALDPFARLFRIRCACAAVLALSGCVTPHGSDSTPRLGFTRMVAHWAHYADDGYLPFIEDAKVEVAQVGFYGAHFWSLAHTPQYGGYPAHFPVQGLRECGRWFEDLNRELHRRKVKVIGHFNVMFLVGDPEGPDEPRGFFRFYRELWDEKELGPKPVADPLELLEKNTDGTPIVNDNYKIGGMKEYWACQLNPHWRAVLKAWVKRGIERGVDGFVINYFYRHNCLCEHCQSAFREYLAERFTADELKEKLGIDDLATHKFTEIGAWHDPKESTLYKREALRFSQIATKRAFDEVFVEYGRSLKPGLIVAQWNHLGNFNQINGDERCLLPSELWGKDEDYLWYSTGGAACYTDLAEGYLGEGTLQARYIRGAFDDKPFTLGKYEQTRIRVAIAELAANGGAPMGFYTNFKDPVARAVIVRYYRFLARYDAIYRANRPYAETTLFFPRGTIHRGEVERLVQFREAGNKLLNDHALFGIEPDDRPLLGFGYADEPLYRTKSILLPNRLSRFDAPITVRVSASRPARGNEIDLHFVNYNRIEPEKKKSPGSGIEDEKPVAVSGIKVDFVLPAEQRATRVTVISPESPEPVTLEFEQSDGRVRFTLPEFLVYAVARIELKRESRH